MLECFHEALVWGGVLYPFIEDDSACSFDGDHSMLAFAHADLDRSLAPGTVSGSL